MQDPSASYMPFRGSVFFEDELVEAMDLEAVGLYVAMLWRSWRSGPVSADPAFWRRVYGARCSDFDAAWAQVIPCWSLVDDGRIVQRRLEVERAHRDTKKRRGAGVETAAWDAAQKAVESRIPADPTCVAQVCSTGVQHTKGTEGKETEGERSTDSAPTKPSASPERSASQAPAAPVQTTLVPDEPRPKRGRPKKPEKPSWRKAVNSAFGKWWEKRWEDSRGTAWAWSAAERAGVDAATGKAVTTLQIAKVQESDAQRVLGVMTQRAEVLLSGRNGQDAWMAENAAPRILSSKWNELAGSVVRRQVPKSQSSVEREIARARAEGLI